MCRVISIANQKGGVGKTTTAINLTASLGKLGKKILLIDIDPQGNTTSGYGIDKQTTELSSYDILGETSITDTIITTEYENVDIVPSNINLAAAEIELVDMDNRVMRIRQAIAPVKDKYDFIIIDCPPSLGLITLNSLTASDAIIIPMQCEYYSLEGISQLIATVKQVKRLYNPSIDIDGILFTMYDGRLKLTLQVVDEIKKFFRDKVYKTVIPRNVKLSEAPSFGMPVVYFERNSKGAVAYMELAKEIIGTQV